MREGNDAGGSFLRMMLTGPCYGRCLLILAPCSLRRLALDFLPLQDPGETRGWLLLILPCADCC